MDTERYSDSDRNPDFEDWYKDAGYKLFAGNKQAARQWYEQRKRKAKPAVAMGDLMKKAMG